MKINLGSGINKIDGFKRVDIDPITKPDYCFNVEKDKWVFDDNSVDELRAFNLLEHLRDIDFFFEEAYRVLKPNGVIKIAVPHYRSEHAYSDPDHVRYFTPETFSYWARTTIGSDGRPVVRGKMDFKITELKAVVDERRKGTFEEEVRASGVSAGAFWLPLAWIFVTMKAIKPARELVV